jgi:hypothetical protein
LLIASSLWLRGIPALEQTQVCRGDCDENGFVTVQEIVIGISIALGTRPIVGCDAFDTDGSGSVTVDELLTALANALDGCPPTSPVPTPTPAYSGPMVFVDVTADAGLAHSKLEPRQPPHCLRPPVTTIPLTGLECSSENFAAGAAAGDADGDGLIDLYVTRIYEPDILFRNRGDGTFEDVTAYAGLDRLRYTNGAAFGDIDNDGDLDLYVTTVGETANLLYINDGNGRFAEEGSRRGAAILTDTPHYGMGIAFGDYDRDGWIDLYTAEWVQYFDLPPFPPSHSRLLRNLGSENPGHFEDVTERAGVTPPILDPNPPAVLTFAPAFVDLDRDGWQDLAITGDSATTRLYWNNRDGTFTDGTTAAGLSTSQSDMGSTFGDYDGDGDLDWFISSISCQDPFVVGQSQDWRCEGNLLMRYDGDRRFSDQTAPADVAIGHWGWGAAFLDVDNDSDLDLAMTNGMRLPGTIDAFVTQGYHDDPSRFWENDGGSMTDISTEIGFDDTDLGKGLLTFDYDNDGDLDLFVANSNAPPRLYRNDGGNRNRWLRVQVTGTRSNRDGLGAIVTLRATADGPAQFREIGVGTHFLGQSEHTAHFGLGPGDAPIYELRVVWPLSGAVETLSAISPNQTIILSEPRPVATDP